MPEIVRVELTDQDLKKHVAAIHIENRLSLLERKMANVLLLNAYPNLLMYETHRIRIKDLADVLGFDSNDRDCLKKALMNLMSTVLTWNIIDKQGNEKAWKARPMLMSADIERNWCIYGYHKDIRQKFFNPEIYSRINLGIQRRFTSGHALALYENCLRYRSTGSTGWWSLEVFRKLMGVGDNDYYTDFRRLNSKVIKPAIKQVNETSDIFLKAETKCEKRRVVSVRFSIKNNPQMSLFSAQVKLPPPPEEHGVADSLRSQLFDFGLREKEVDFFLKEHNAAYIRENLEIVADMLARGAIKTTLRAAALDALKTDYRPRRTPYELQQEAQKAQKQQAEARLQEDAQRAEEYERLRREFDKYRLQKVLEGLPDKERQALEKHFESAHKINPIFRKCFKKGYEHPVIQSLFRNFARQELLEEFSEAEFAAFVESQGD